MSNLYLRKNPTLKNYQNYIREMVKERGFDQETITEIYLLFIEECGELAKAIRKSQAIHSDKNSKQHELEHEVADIFMYLLDICNYFNIDLETAFRAKEELNKQRVWTIMDKQSKTRSTAEVQK